MIENLNQNKYGLLFNNAVKLHRQYFREAVKLIGIYVLYRAPKKDKHWTTYAEVEGNYEQPILVGCLFHDHPDQKTLKKIGWVSELQESASLIDVDYDLPGLEVGALFIIPSGLDDGKGRLFRVYSMQNSMVYPATITCQIVPEWEDTIHEETYFDYSDSSINYLNRQDEYNNLDQQEPSIIDILNHDIT